MPDPQSFSPADPHVIYRVISESGVGWWPQHAHVTGEQLMTHVKDKDVASLLASKVIVAVRRDESAPPFPRAAATAEPSVPAHTPVPSPSQGTPTVKA